MTPAELAAQTRPDAQLAARREASGPPPLPMADIATDGDHRFSPLGEGDEVVSCPKCRIPPPFPGSYLHKGPGRYEVPPSYFLIRGDVESRGPQMQPGFVAGDHPRQSADRDPAARRPHVGPAPGAGPLDRARPTIR